MSSRIAKDAIPEPDANAIEGDPTRVSNAAGFAGGERTQNLVFPVVLKPDAETITVDGAVRAADLRHGGHGRAQDRRAADARISVLAAGRSRVKGDAGAVNSPLLEGVRKNARLSTGMERGWGGAPIPAEPT